MINRNRNNPWHWTIVRALMLALLAAGSSSAPVGSVAYAQLASEVGQWESLAAPVPATNEVVLPTGLVLIVALGGQQNWGTLWDPVDDIYTPNPARRRLRRIGSIYRIPQRPLWTSLRPQQNQASRQHDLIGGRRGCSQAIPLPNLTGTLCISYASNGSTG